MIENNNISGEHIDTTTPSIGVASMEEDGTITLRLRAVGPGICGDGLLTYKPTSPDYNDILEHLGGLKPGEYKPVQPWED